MSLSFCLILLNIDGIKSPKLAIPPNMNVYCLKFDFIYILEVKKKIGTISHISSLDLRVNLLANKAVFIAPVLAIMPTKMSGFEDS